MKQSLINQKFWDKPILKEGTHKVKISNLELGVNTGLRKTPFAILIYENKNGWFPHKINLDIKSSQNIKYIKTIFEKSETESKGNYIDDINLLLHKEIEIFIGALATVDFGQGIKVNTLSHSKK